MKDRNQLHGRAELLRSRTSSLGATAVGGHEGAGPDPKAVAAGCTCLCDAGVALPRCLSDCIATGTINALLGVTLGLDDSWPTVRREPAQQLMKIVDYRDLD